MKKAIVVLLSLKMLLFTPHLFAYCPEDEMTRMQRYSNDTYLPLPSTEDGGFTATTTSMLAWGIALGVIFAIVSASVSPSTASNGS